MLKVGFGKYMCLSIGFNKLGEDALKTGEQNGCQKKPLYTFQLPDEATACPPSDASTALLFRKNDVTSLSWRRLSVNRSY